MKLSDSLRAPYGSSLCKHVENHTVCIVSPHDVSKNFGLCRISRGWRWSMFNFQTWATSEFVPIEGQLVVFLALTGQMSHTHVWLGKYSPSVHSRVSPDPVSHAPLIVRVFPSPHGIHTGPYGSRKSERTAVPMPVWNPQRPLRCPHG